MKTVEEVLAGVAEEALHRELQAIFWLSPSDDNIKNGMKKLPPIMA